MSKMVWERVAGSAARLATISLIAAFAATTSAAAESKAPVQGKGAKVPASYGQTWAQPMWGQPAYGQPFQGSAQFRAPAFGQPAYGAAIDAPRMPGAQMPRTMIAPASTSTFAPAVTATLPAGAPKLPHHAQQHRMPAPAFGQRLPIFANTQANGITYGPPSYTPPKDFDPKTASSSPFPSDWHRPAWGRAPMQAPGAKPAPMPSLAGAPVYGGAWGQRMAPATASQFAPAEPTYAPAEPLRPNYAAAPATYAPAAPATYAPAAPAPAQYESVDVTPAPAAPATTAAPAPATTQTYSYEMAPATSAPAYVGQSTEIGTTYATAPATETAPANPYEVVIGQTGEIKSYEAAPAYQEAPAYQPAPAYDSTATSGYEMTTTVEAAPAYPAATSYATQGYETVTAAPAYEAATPTYQAAIASTDFGSSSFSNGSNHFVQVGAFRNPARAERLVRKLQGAGEQPIVTQAIVRGKQYHRVRVPAMDKRDAKAVQTRIRGLGYYEARMVRG